MFTFLKDVAETPSITPECEIARIKLARILQEEKSFFPEGAFWQFKKMSSACRHAIGMSNILVGHNTQGKFTEFKNDNKGSNEIRKALQKWANTIDLPEQIKPIETQEAPKDITEIKKGLKGILVSLWRGVVA